MGLSKTCAVLSVVLVFCVFHVSCFNHLYNETLLIDSFPSRQFIAFLKKYGYIEDDIYGFYDLFTETGRHQIISEVQKFSDFPMTGELDLKTIKLMNMPRCGLPDVSTHKLNNVWKKTDITYYIANFPKSEMNQNEIINDLHTAFLIWGNHAKVKFLRIFEQADITIGFYEGYHGDRYAFDATNTSIAHTSLSSDKENPGADIHFNNAEVWSKSIDKGKHFFSTAFHQIGHALGVPHSIHFESPMFPYYRPNNNYLTQNDADTIMQAYGNGNFGNKGANTAAPNVCDGNYDAVAFILNKFYFFKDNKIWTVNSETDLVASNSISLQSEFPGLPKDFKINAVYQRDDGKLVFFSGKQFWVYEKTTGLVENSPKPISVYGLPNIDSVDAVVPAFNNSGDTFIFKNTLFWRYNKDGILGTANYISGTFKGIPTNLDAVATVKDNMYFFKDTDFWQYKKNGSRVMNNSPRSAIKYWFECSKDDIF